MYLDKLELYKLLHVCVADDSENGGDDVHGGVSHVTERHQQIICLHKAPSLAVLDDPGHKQRVWLVADLEDVLLAHETEPAVGGLRDTCPKASAHRARVQGLVLALQHEINTVDRLTVRHSEQQTCRE